MNALDSLKLLSQGEEIAALAERLKDEAVIAFDTEFIRESTFFPIVEIIQVATETETWLVDAQAFKRNHAANDPQSYDSKLKPLLDIFTNPGILKIVHAAQGDQECLYTSFGTVASPTLDTAVAASLCGHGDGVGLGKLLKMVLGVTLMKGHARTNWSVRPLPKQLDEYARADVQHLVLLGKKLLGELDQSGRRAWAMELSAKWENKALYEADIEGMTQKLARGGRFDSRGAGVLSALVQWRENRVRQLNLPRRWVADDHVLVDLARVKPKDLDHLGTFRGLNKGELRNSGLDILEAIRKAEQSEGLHVAKSQGSGIPSQEEAQILDLLRCYVNILADRHKIAAKHLLTTNKLLPLLRSKSRTFEDLEKAGILTGEAARLIGAELLALLNGERMLLVRGGQVEIETLPKKL